MVRNKEDIEEEALLEMGDDDPDFPVELDDINDELD